MSQKAAVVLLDDWHPLCLVSVWNHPESEASRAPVAPRYFDVICRGEHYVDAYFGVVWGRKFIQRHLFLICGRMEGPLQTHRKSATIRFLGK